MENAQAGAGTGRLNPSREAKFSGTYGDRGIFIFPVQLTTNRIGNLTRLIHTLLYVMAIHTLTGLRPGTLPHTTQSVIRVLKTSLACGLKRGTKANRSHHLGDIPVGPVGESPEI